MELVLCIGGASHSELNGKYSNGMGAVDIKRPDIGIEPGGVYENFGGDVKLFIIVVICGENFFVVCVVFVEVFNDFTIFVVTINCLNEFKLIRVLDEIVASDGGIGWGVGCDQVVASDVVIGWAVGPAVDSGG